MGRGGRIRHRHRSRSRRRPAAPPDAVPTAVYGLTLEGSDPQCGCPVSCCHSRGPVVPEALPEQLRELYTVEQWKMLKKRVDDIQDSTVFPFFPCIFTHFCIPFLPVCVMCCCESRRSSLMQEWADGENARLAVQGLKWVPTPRRGATCLALTWMPDVRPQFEAREPGVRRLLQEGLAEPWWGQEDKQAWAALMLGSIVAPGAASPGVPNFMGAAEESQRKHLFGIDVQRRLLLAAGVSIAGIGPASVGPPPHEQMLLQPQMEMQMPMPMPMPMQTPTQVHMLQGPPVAQSMGGSGVEGAVEMQSIAAMMSLHQSHRQQFQQSQQPHKLQQPVQQDHCATPQLLVAQPQQSLQPLQQQQPSEGLTSPSAAPSAFAANDLAFTPAQLQHCAPVQLQAPASPSAVTSAPEGAVSCHMCGAVKKDPTASMCASCGAAN